MKTLNSVVSAIVMSVIVSSSAMAAVVGTATATWGGTTGKFAEGCFFKENEAGTMSLSGNTWTVNKHAYLRIKTRNVGNIEVESDNRLRTAAGVDVDLATVNYTGTGVAGGATFGGVVNTNPTMVSIGNLKNGNGVKDIRIHLRGTAVMANTDELSSTTEYKINHTVTCIQ